MSTLHLRHGRRRRGAILVIVVAFLALGLSLGIAFLFFANQHAVNMRIYREALQTTATGEEPPNPEDIANETYKQLVFDVPDDSFGADSALRGWSLGRTMYGLYYSYVGTPAAITYANNNIPFNGIGRFRASTTDNPSSLPPLFGALDASAVLNYQYFPADGFVLDPERLGYRTLPTDQAWSTGATNYIPLNAPYTYPDGKDLYLGAINPLTGQVMLQSFYRPNVFGALNDPANPNWTNAVGKYLIMRPRPADHAGFPYPTDPGGDVKNLDGAPGGNDSIWIDIGLPVKKWRGVDYKPLVAMLIVDLDGRVNINTSGNNRGTGGAHASLQGWGGWEVNPYKIFTLAEASNLFAPPAGQYGRYGSDNLPTKVYGPDGQSVNSAPSPRTIPFYSAINYDGTGGGVLTLPSGGQTSPTYGAGYEAPAVSAGKLLNHPLLYSPHFLSSAKPTSPTAADRVYGLREMFLLNNKYNTDQTNYAASELGQLLPNTLQPDWAAGTVNPRYLFTTGSNDVLRPGISPWLRNIPAGGQRYQLNQVAPVGGFYPPAQQPTPGGVQFPTPATQRSVPDVAGTVNDFDLTWKSKWSAYASIDLNRALRDYRSDLTKGFEVPGNVTAAQATLAITDRQRLAKDIFDRLCYAVGANNDPTYLASITPTAGAAPSFLPTTGATPEYLGLRYLAQLAVNIVDQIDNDDYSTPFVWNPISPADPLNAANFTPQMVPLRVVFGTELPRLVINEAAVRIENGSTANMAASDYDSGLVPPAVPPMGWQPTATFYVGKVWVELHNPLTPGTASTASLADGGGARLRFDPGTGAYDVYKIKLTQNNTMMRHADNVDGRTNAAAWPNNSPVKTAGSGSTDVSLSDATVTSVYAGAGHVIPYSNGNYSQGRAATSSFCVVGPGPTPGTEALPVSIQTPFMQFRLETAQYATSGQRVPVDIVLQRLACPHLPPSAFNPYITVDYMQFTGNAPAPQTAAVAWDGRTVSNTGPIPAASQVQVETNHSYGRRQPFAGKQPDAGDPADNVPAQQLNTPPAAGVGMYHSFFRHNGRGATFANDGNLTQPFDWLVHFDRELVSPAELTMASAYKPHELMQQFVNGNGTHRHLASLPAGAPGSAWAFDTARLHRALSLLDTRPKTLGVPHGGRMPGLVNINTMWHQSIWNAVCDPQSGNFFNQTAVDNAWTALSSTRTPGGSPSAAGFTDKPFWSLGAPIDPGSTQFPNKIGVNDTILRGAGGLSTLETATGQSHPYLRKDLLNKVYNKLTTRSNTFAVWMTVGYFQVMDTSTKPVKLGAEVGIGNGTNVRHRFFAIIDRTNLTQNPANLRLQGPRPVFFSYEPAQTNGLDPATPGTVSAYIPGALNNGMIRGTYEDTSWQITTGTPLVVDVGAGQETVTVQAVGSGAGGAMIQFACANAHARGCALMIGNTILGNPGPQPGFFFRDPLYTPVIPVVVQTQ